MDLLFTDIIMPGGVNGLVLAEKARQHFPALSVVFMTGYTDELYSQEADPSCMNILNNPYRRSELAEHIYTALNRSEAAALRRSSNFLPEGQTERCNIFWW